MREVRRRARTHTPRSIFIFRGHPGRTGEARLSVLLQSFLSAVSSASPFPFFFPSPSSTMQTALPSSTRGLVSARRPAPRGRLQVVAAATVPADVSTRRRRECGKLASDAGGGGGGSARLHAPPPPHLPPFPFSPHTVQEGRTRRRPGRGGSGQGGVYVRGRHPAADGCAGESGERVWERRRSEEKRRTNSRPVRLGEGLVCASRDGKDVHWRWWPCLAGVHGRAL